MKEWGEILPITVGSDKFYIFNCLTFGAVKEDLCEKAFYEGEDVGLKTIVFESQDVTAKLIFKTDLNSCMELYCGDRLKNIIEEYKLTRVIFSEKLIADFN
ncbi:MAG: hypothetical protein EOO53_11870 [Gammaproteobacteria bacterium]|nr:MAG: hypothetical protein EOO53_11870 [Gammaproteobacteria bacterium]